MLVFGSIYIKSYLKLKSLDSNVMSTKVVITNVYESIIYNEDANLPIFKRLKNAVDNVFDKAEDTYLENTIFNDNKDYYEKLKKIHARKVEIQRLKELSSLSKPFVIEFCGTPRTGKTITINNLYDFFKKGGFIS